MEILDNARIVKELTDKGVWSVWGYITSLLQEIEISEKKIACLRNGKECEQCKEWWLCVGGLRGIDIDNFEQGFDNHWEKAIEDLNLEDLHHWLIDGSGSKDELKFRLDKVRGIVGAMWSDEEIAQLHIETSGIRPNGEMQLRSDGTILGGIVPRMIEAITTLNDNETEESATTKVEKVWDIVETRLFQIECIISYIRAMLKEADNILDPRPDTSTEQEQTVVKLPPELDTPQAHIIWSKAKHNGWINEDYTFNGTRQQMCYAADIMGSSLNLKNKWKPFIDLWGYKAMAQTRWRGLNGYETISRMKDIQKSFSI